MFANLPSEFFQSKGLVEQFWELLQGIGPVVSWAPQPAFQQCLVVFEHATDARRVKQLLDRVLLPSTEWDSASTTGDQTEDAHRLRVYLHHNTRLAYLPSGECVVAQSMDTAGPHLAPPAPEREFLISPPGSPPVGWEPREEEQPNKDTLAQDLIEALTKLARLTDKEAAAPAASAMLIPPGAVQVPGVVLEAAEDEEPASLVAPSPPSLAAWPPAGDRPRPTARPPL